ncbi:MAG: CPBP family intramembrane glutamic endopeptidase [Prevotella sp.]|nr:CPBP family intramembrane glutamic endopeptidase [Prevotella sp.]
MMTIRNTFVRAGVDVMLYLILFLLLQILFSSAAMLVGKYVEMGPGVSMAASSALSAVATIWLFAYRRWSPYSRRYLAGRPWAVLLWVVLLAFGSIAPSEWMLEQLELDMPADTLRLLEQVMATPWGYMAVGVLIPVAEEMVFRGAVLRRLLAVTSKKRHWVAIVISALVFGGCHGNGPQFVHATLVGLLLGWMYYRTDSIVPGVVFHWVNNSVAFVAYNLLPQSSNGTISDLFGGNQTTVMMLLLFSLCIFLPSLFQLTQRLRRTEGES